jgi:hypothetical protein
MKARSPEALARRAAKRGLSVEELRAQDRKDEKKRKRDAEAEAEAERSAKARASATEAAVPMAVGVPWYKLEPDKRPVVERKLKKDEKAGWVCMGVKGQACGEINFAYRDVCRRCGAKVVLPASSSRAKPAGVEAPMPAAKAAGFVPNPALSPDAVQKAAAAAAAAGEAGKCFKCGGEGHWARHCTMVAVEKKAGPGRREKPPSDPSRAWEGTNAEGAAEHNAQLRKQFASDPGALTEEERSRAEALLARDARKAAKRDAIKSAKAASAALFKAAGPAVARGSVLSSVKGRAPGSTTQR